jgi:hypothetical protein
MLHFLLTPLDPRSWIEVSRDHDLTSPITGKRMGDSLLPNVGVARLLELLEVNSSKSVLQDDMQANFLNEQSESKVL